MPQRIFVGTAGWSIPRASAHRCPGQGTHLERYACALRGAEINSSFHRSHAAATYEKWAAATPRDFRFAVKVPRTITHDQQLRRARVPVERFLKETDGLGDKRGPLLVQLPPSLSFDARVAGRFFALLRADYDGFLVCEPRHETWFSAAAEALLVRFKVARVAADPPPAVGADWPGGWTGIVYHRLHGAPSNPRHENWPPGRRCPPTRARSRAPGPAPSASTCEPYRDLIAEALGRGRNAMAIWQDLVDDHGFTARYASVRRFVLAVLRKNDRRHVLVATLGPALGRRIERHFGLITAGLLKRGCKLIRSQLRSRAAFRIFSVR